MNAFKDFNIKPTINAFVGDKIKIDRVINMPITIHGFKIEASTIKEGTKRLTLQIEKNQTKHIIFTGSKVLQQQIEQVPKDKFPFVATIKKDNEYFEFT